MASFRPPFFFSGDADRWTALLPQRLGAKWEVNFGANLSHWHTSTKHSLAFDRGCPLLMSITPAMSTGLASLA